MTMRPFSLIEKFTGIEGLISERISLVEELGLYWTEDPCKNKEKNNVSLLNFQNWYFNRFDTHSHESYDRGDVYGLSDAVR